MQFRGWKHLLAVATGVALGSPLHAQSQMDALVHRLADVSTFAFGGAGFAGVTSDGETQFRLIAAQEKQVALDAFEKLYAAGDVEAKAYALAGIRKLDPARFRALLSDVSGSAEQVTVMNGCIVDRMTLGKIAKRIGHNDFRYWIDRDFARPNTGANK